MALTRKTAPTIPFTLTLVGQGEEVVLKLVYHNRKQSELSAKFAEENTMSDLVRYLVKEWDAEYALTEADLIELEDARPGTLMAVMEGYHQARTMAKSKN